MAAVAATLSAGCVLVPRDDHHGVRALDEGHTVLGAWLGDWPSDQNRLLRRFEQRADARLHLVDIYMDWSTPFANASHSVESVARQGALPILTWEAHGVTTADVVAGQKRLHLRDGTRPTIDAYLGDFAAGACAAADRTGQPILLRVFHEMNGDWFSWGQTYRDADGDRPNTDATYKRAWMKVHGVFRAECDDVRFVWAVNHYSIGDGASFTGTYPGDAYVDIVGLDGYNWGRKADWGWQEPAQIFDRAYCTVVTVTDRPILLAEVASTESGGDKARWIHDLFDWVEAHPRVHGLVWLDDAKHEVQAGDVVDWAVDSSPAARAAFASEAQKLHERAVAGRPPDRDDTGC